MKYYPAFLDLRGRKCLVAGGGAVALQKARSLLRCGAAVTAVAPDFAPGFRRLRGAVLRRKKFSEADLSGAWLAVAATDDEHVNRALAAACARRRIWANVVDKPALCGYIVPAVVRRGALTFAVSTGGASPALAKFVGGKIRRDFGPGYARLARNLARRRPEFLKMPLRARRAAVGRLLRRLAGD